MLLLEFLVVQTLEVIGRVLVLWKLWEVLNWKTWMTFYFKLCYTGKIVLDEKGRTKTQTPQKFIVPD
jgi:hypothetical protein